jgi:ABC-type bacteriocin/lantibiotic exporter with double-glycine peptidase domain
MASPPPLVRSVLLEFWRASRLMLLLVSAMTIGTACASLAAPYLFSRMVDRFDPRSLGPALTFGLVAYAVLVGFSSALAQAQAYLANVCGERLALIVSTTVFDRVMRKTAAFFVEHNPVQIETAARRGEEALMTMMHLTVGYLVTGTVQIVIGLALIGATMSLEVVAVSVLYGAGFIALSIFADRRSKRFLEAAIAAGQENAVFVGNVLTGMETLRHFGAQGWMRSVFAEKANAVFDNWRAFSLGRIGFTALQGAALAVQLAVTFFMLLPRLEAGLISVGDIVLFNTLILTLNEPFEAIGVTINELAKTRGSLSPLRVIWQAP